MMLASIAPAAPAFPWHDWQFWIATTIALVALIALVRKFVPATWLPGFLARGKPRGRKVTLTIDGKTPGRNDSPKA